MNNVRKVQMTQMEILRLFMDICERHRLRWYMIGGSLIGVLRHKGFIPWDDDIDIGMPRKDYDKFVSLQAEYPDGYGLTCHGNTPEWQFNFIFHSSIRNRFFHYYYRILLDYRYSQILWFKSRHIKN